MLVNLPDKRYYSIGEIAKAFNVNTSLNETLNANVFDVAGKLIYTSTLSNSSTIDLSNFGKGTYILELSNSKGSHKETLTVQ